MRPLLVLRVGYMARYDGVGPISNGGAFVDANGVGGEVFNFKPGPKGLCYGYAMSRHFGGVNLKMLDASTRWKIGDSLEGVDVVFIARKAKVGQVVVGWYRNATVIHREYWNRPGHVRGLKPKELRYLCFAQQDDVTLLAEEQRTFTVPAAQTGARGFHGQSNVWYPEKHIHQHDVAAFIKKLRTYVTKNSAPHGPSKAMPPVAKKANGKGGHGRRPAPNQSSNLMVEAAAMDIAQAYYEDAGFSVKRVHLDYVGWDMEARKKGKALKVEVKGMQAQDIYFELTPNEFAKLKKHAVDYRVCAVCGVLSDDVVTIYDLEPEQRKDDWWVCSADRKVQFLLTPREAAVCRGIVVGKTK